MREQAVLDARGLRLRTRRDVAGGLHGAYRSAFRGQGLTFEELRDYTPGDDVRWMEWNATARLGRPIVKRMCEERDLILGLLVDSSASLVPGTGDGSRRTSAQRAAAALATAAVAAQDRFALATFADAVSSAIAPRGGSLQLERAFRALTEDAGTGSGGVVAALEWAADTLPRHSVVIVISDWLFPDPGAALRRCARKHELIALRLVDALDRVPPGLPALRVRGSEARRPRVWRRRAARPSEGRYLTDTDLRRLGVDVGRLHCGRRLAPSLHRFFDARATHEA